jgi:hypothetical protein
VPTETATLFYIKYHQITTAQIDDPLDYANVKPSIFLP